METAASSLAPPRPTAQKHRARGVVKVHFVARVADHRALLGESFQRVARDEPGRFDVVFFEELEHAPGADGAGEQSFVFVSSVYMRMRRGDRGTSRYVGW